MSVRSIEDLPESQLRGKRVLLRADLNLPLDAKGNVADAFRAARSWKTIQYLSERGARVVVISHIGRDPEESLAPVAEALAAFGKVFFVGDITGQAARDAIAAMQDGEVVLLENLRRDPREKANDESFARELAGLADLYVGDGFAVAHRAHASVVGIAKLLPAYAGVLMREEIEHANEARNPTAPSLALLGGAKFETKAPLIRLLLEKYDRLFIAGALANDVFKARGLQVGRSLVSEEKPSEDILTHPGFLAPVDVTVERSDGQARVVPPERVEADDKIVDIGPDSVALLAPHIQTAKFILWNGPTGLYENGYVSYVGQIAKLVARAHEGGAKVVIGGGDTIAAIERAGAPQDSLGFLSTGGGAMLEYLLKGTLPGISALL